MCGIIAYLGKNNCFDYIFNGLYQLQNRGYDSVGILTIKNNNPDFPRNLAKVVTV